MQISNTDENFGQTIIIITWQKKDHEVTISHREFTFASADKCQVSVKQVDNVLIDRGNQKKMIKSTHWD